MQDDKLKELIQAVLDGKQLQWDFYYEKDRTGWKHYVNKQGVQSLLKSVLNDLGNVAIRIKPEVKTFKYKTRPFSADTGAGVWTSTQSHNEKEFEHIVQALGVFKWLAPATEHEVELHE